MKIFMRTGRKRRRRKSPVAYRPPRLTVTKILGWADDFHERTGRWPKMDSGRITGALGETWLRVHHALRQGLRGLPGGSSLPRLLYEHRAVRNHMQLPALTPAQILAWADAHFARRGHWPTAQSGSIAGAPAESWRAIKSALQRGRRGLPGGSSLARLLAEHRGVRNRKGLPRLTPAQILAWADVYQRRTGRWPHHNSGAIAESHGETWTGVDTALSKGLRGLPGGSSLAQLLTRSRGVRNRGRPPRLTIREILAWVDAHHRRTGRWPRNTSGVIHDAPEENWMSVHNALVKGLRGLPGGSTLAKLLARHRGVRNTGDLPPLTIPQILAWADAHHRRTGHWPRHNSGFIHDAPGEKWMSVESSLRMGLRGLPGGSSLARLLRERRGSGHGRR